MAKKRSKNKDNAKKAKRKTSILTAEKIEYVDWKDVNLLRRFMSERAKIRARRVTGNSAQQQREVAQAVKNAREMALLPYAQRVVTHRRSDRGSRRAASEPPPTPSGPPPAPPPAGAGAGAGQSADAGQAAGGGADAEGTR